MTFDILIVNWNSGDYLAKCLAAIFVSVVSADTAYRVVVVDNGSSDDSASRVKDDFSSVEWIETGKNLGFAAANNLAGKRAQGEWTLFLNPDTELAPDALETLGAYIRSHPETRAAAPQLLNPDGTFQNYYNRFPTLGAIMLRHTLLERFARRGRAVRRYLMEDEEFITGMTIEQPPAAALAVRRDALDRIGWMDTDFPLFFNDVDLCRRLNKSGVAVVYVGESRVTHHARRSLMNAARGDVETEYFISMQKYFLKHRGVPAFCALKCTLALDFSLRAAAVMFRLAIGRMTPLAAAERLRRFGAILLGRGRLRFEN